VCHDVSLTRLMEGLTNAQVYRAGFPKKTLRHVSGVVALAFDSHLFARCNTAVGARMLIPNYNHSATTSIR